MLTMRIARDQSYPVADRAHGPVLRSACHCAHGGSEREAVVVNLSGQIANFRGRDDRLLLRLGCVQRDELRKATTDRWARRNDS